MNSEQLESMSRLQVDIDEEVKTRAKLEAIRSGVTLSELVEKALRAYLDRAEKQSEKGGRSDRHE